MIIKIVLALSLFVIFLQDFTKGLISILVFPIILGCFGYLSYTYMENTEIVAAIAKNVLFVGITLLVLEIVLRIKYGKQQFEYFQGLGDYLMYVALCFSMGTMAFIFFLITGLISGSLIFSLVLGKSKESNDQLYFPAAGFLALYFLMIFIVQWMTDFEGLYS